MNLNLVQKYTGDSYLFHYTNMQIAIEHILFDKKLRLSPRRSTNDPIEKERYIIDIISNSGDGSRDKSNVINNFTIVKNNIENWINELKQISFCMNGTKNSFGERRYQAYEYFGFLKPRMWDQYASKYTGICLVFDKNELIKEFDQGMHDKVKYYKYKKLDECNVLNFQTKIRNSKKQEDILKRAVKKIIFRKHLDYKGENEYRFISDKVTIDNFYYLNIDKSLKGIFASSNYISNFAKNYLGQYSDENKIDFFLIDWNSKGIEIRNGISDYELVKNLKLYSAKDIFKEITNDKIAGYIDPIT